MSARTLAVPLPSPAPSAQFQLDPNVKLRVESVFVTIDNSGGGDIKPTLTVSDQNTQEVAAKRQGETIPAGDTGSATWALRLTDETPASGAGGISLEHNGVPV